MKNTSKTPAIATGISFIVLWQLVALYINAAYILPSPLQVLLKIYELRKELFLYHMPYTMGVTLISLIISTVLGVLLSMLMESDHRIEAAIYPIVVISQTIPITALAPLFILWLGYGIWSKVMVAVMITFFPITISVHDGFKNTKKEHVELLKSFGASEKDIFFKLKIMSALPNMFSAMKMAIPLCIIGAAIGEWLGAQQGLGYFSKRMMSQLSGAGVFAPIVILSIVAVVIVQFISLLEKKIIHYRTKI